MDFFLSLVRHTSAYNCVSAAQSVLHCVAVCCSVLQCVAVCCSALMFLISDGFFFESRNGLHRHIIVFRIRKVCCSVLQCVAVCCSVLTF